MIDDHESYLYKSEDNETEDNGIMLSIGDLMSGVFLFFVLLYVIVVFQLREVQIKLTQSLVQAEDQLKELELARKELAQLRETRRIFIGTLKDQLQGNNINVEVNEETGDISVRDSILFDFGSAVLKPEGQSFLSQFVPIYSKVIFSDPEIADQVVRIVIEGHTSSAGTYESNLELSLLRSLSVSRYIFSGAINFPTKNQLSQKILASGRGEIEADQIRDNPADRRVVFRFQFRGEIVEGSTLQRELVKGGGQ
jgi:outer membrane protein OmpA-like peptidoglycan-associated protein